ncbi:MAG: helix-hairpin-helix domain-containing protein [Bacteroidota bacterium]
MINKLLREFFLLPRGEQRAMILVSMLLILSLGVRIAVPMLPARDPSGMEEFVEVSRRVMAELAKADSLAADSLAEVRKQSAAAYKEKSSYRNPPVRRNPTHLLAQASIPLNTIDSAGLLPLPGIGPVFAGRIVKYRNLLGGYVSSDQLMEVYGLDRERVQRIAPLLYIDTSDITLLHLNTAGFRELLRHPYLEYEDVKVLVNYRDEMGKFTSLREIREHALLPDSSLERVRAYLKL